MFVPLKYTFKGWLICLVIWKMLYDNNENNRGRSMKIRYGVSKDANIIKIAVMVFLVGVLLGAIGANVFKDAYFKDMKIFGEGYFDKLYVLDIDHGKLFGYIFWNNLKKYLLFWIFSVTVVGIPYMVFSVGYSGLSTGFLLAVSVLKFGVKGIFLFLLYIFPQYLIYFPVALITLIQGYHLCTNLYFRVPLNKKGKAKIILEKVPTILILFLIILIGALSEAYINSFIIQKMARYF